MPAVAPGTVALGVGRGFGFALACGSAFDLAPGQVAIGVGAGAADSGSGAGAAGSGGGPSPFSKRRGGGPAGWIGTLGALEVGGANVARIASAASSSAGGSRQNVAVTSLCNALTWGNQNS